MNLKDEYQIKFLKHHVEEEKNNGKKLSVQEEDLKILNILKRKCRLVISQNVLLFVATLNLLPRFCILIVLDVFEFHRLVVSKIVRFHYRSSVFAF